MNASSFTRRLFVIGLAASTAACHHSPASAQEKDGPVASPPAAPAAPTPPPNQQLPADPLTREAEIEARAELRESEQRQLEAAQRQKDAANRAKDAAMRAATVAGKRVEDFRIAQPFRVNVNTKGMWMQAIDGPAVITTTPINAAVQAEWKEDLDVMDKLLRESAGGIEGAMGIISLGRVNPMYIEGAGVVLGASVAWPLAAGTNSEADPNLAATRPSKWANARRELRGEPAPEGMGKGRSRQTFDQARLDHFVDAVLKTLPEASNFRHLKPEEWVFVTVNGADEDGKPVRLTLKAKKSDIDAASNGTIDAQAFSKRVARRIG